MMNFLTNALKFTNKGGKVAVHIDILDNQLIKGKQSYNLPSPHLNEDRYISFNLRISDSGVGISSENMRKLFVDFGKLDD